MLFGIWMLAELRGLVFVDLSRLSFWRRCVSSSFAVIILQSASCARNENAVFSAPLCVVETTRNDRTFFEAETKTKNDQTSKILARPFTVSYDQR
jgi:hypothetical protein